MDTAIKTLLDQIAVWWQSVALTFVDGIAAFLPPAQGSDPLYTSHWGFGAKLEPLTTLFTALAVSVVVLKVTADSLRMYMARDAGEQIIAPVAFFRRVAITVVFALTCGSMVNLLSSATGGSVSVVRTTLYQIFESGRQAPAPQAEYPDTRRWLRNIGCWLMLPNSADDGLLRMNEQLRPPEGVPCLGAVEGAGETTLYWLPPDPWVVWQDPDRVEVYNDHRVYHIYRSESPNWADAKLVGGVTSLTTYTDPSDPKDPRLKLNTKYYYWVGTYCWNCKTEKYTGPITVYTDGSYVDNSRTPAGRVFLNILIALSLVSGVIVMVLQTAFRSVELIFAKIAGPFMALSAMNTDEPFVQGALAIWLREVAVLILSQVTQIIVLCAMVSLVQPEDKLHYVVDKTTMHFQDLVLALVLIAIGTQGPRILRHLAWSGDAGKTSSIGGQFVSSIASKFPW